MEEAGEARIHLRHRRGARCQMAQEHLARSQLEPRTGSPSLKR